MKRYVLTLALLLTASLAFAQSPIGKWKTIDDETGKEKSYVEIYEKDGKLYGKILELLKAEDKGKVCDICPDDRKGQKIEGMEIIRGMKKDGDVWEDGTILDPKKGKVYDCEIELDEDNSDILLVRGYLWVFSREQKWHRVK